jgi:hypothetical protein
VVFGFDFGFGFDFDHIGSKDSAMPKKTHTAGHGIVL